MAVARRPFPLLPGAALAGLACLLLAAPAPAADKIPITRLADLPTHVYALPEKPSVMVGDPAAVRALAEAIEQDIHGDFGKYDIQDVTEVRRRTSTLLTIAVLKGDAAAARDLVARVRDMQEKPSAKLTSGRITEAVLAAREAPEGEFDTTLRGTLQASLAALPWEVVQDDLKGTKGYLEYASAGLVLGNLESAIDPAAKDGKLSQQLAEGILGAAYTLSVILPNRDTLQAAYAAVVDANAQARKPDIWAERSVSLAAEQSKGPGHRGRVGQRGRPRHRRAGPAGLDQRRRDRRQWRRR